MFQCLTGEDWTQLDKEYTQAYMFLLHRSLIGERVLLTRELQYKSTLPCRKAWIEKRLGELSAHFESIENIKKGRIKP